MPQSSFMIQSIVVCGSGTMGSGIAQTAAQSGFSTILYDLAEPMLDKARSAIEKNLSSLVEKQKITEDQKHQTLHRLQFTNDISACIGDLVIEAIVEKPEVKTSLLNQLASINQPNTIFATNTSSLSVTEIAKTVAGPERVCGMHFFNPATIMKLVEVVKTDISNDSVIKDVYATAKKMGKVPVICKDAPGFIVNHVARPYYLEALKLIEEGIADVGTVDSIMEATGFKMGPFRLMDLIGNDINYTVSCSVYDAMNKPERLKPSVVQKEKVEKGELGRKTGKGYYEYN